MEQLTAPDAKRSRISYIEDRLKRQTSFTKRKAGIMKKAHELSILTGTEVLLIVATDSGSVFSFATTRMKRFFEDDAGKLQKTFPSCLFMTFSGFVLMPDRRSLFSRSS